MTQLWLCENIPFNNTYENVVDFDNQGQQQSYFKGLSVRTLTTNTIRIIDNKTMFRLDMLYEDSLRLNYIVILQGGKHYYLFIDSVGYVDSKTVNVNATIDYWQTYMFEHEIVDAFIKREHQDRFNNQMKPRFNIEQENIELGTTYETDSSFKVLDPNDNLNKGQRLNWYYIISIEPLNESLITMTNFSVNGTLVGYYLQVIAVDTQGKSVKYQYESKTSSGTLIENIQLMSGVQLEEMFKDPRVVSVYVSKYAPFQYNFATDTNGHITISNEGSIKHSNIQDTINKDDHEGNTLLLYYIDSLDIKHDFKELYYLRNSKFTMNEVNDSPELYNEPKLYTKPFSVFSFTNMSNDSLDLGLDEFDEVYFKESFGTQYKNIMYSNKLDNSKYFNSQVSSKVNDLPLTNDRYLNYIMNNKASATTGMAINAGIGVAGLGLAFMSGGALSYMGMGLAMSSGQKIVGELMKQSDLKQAPQSVKDVGNNVVFQLDLDNDSMFFKGFIRTVRRDYYYRAFELFYRYGYKANRFGVPKLKSRYWFNYVECIDVSIKGNLPQGVITNLETIYKNGVRMWHYKEVGFEMFNYDRENAEVSLIE